MRTISALLMAVGLSILSNSHAHPSTYYSKAISGQVIDYETKKPIEGVIVVAQWELFEEGIGHAPGHVGEMLKIVEVETNRDGKYHIPAWGPRSRPRNKYLYNHDPELVFFKPGYYLEVRRSVLRSHPSSESVRASIWDGESIELLSFSEGAKEYSFWDGQMTVKQPVAGTHEEYSSRLGFFGSEIDRNWPSYPRMTRALYIEVQKLKSLGLKDGYDPYIPEIGAIKPTDRELPPKNRQE